MHEALQDLGLHVPYRDVAPLNLWCVHSGSQLLLVQADGEPNPQNARRMQVQPDTSSPGMPLTMLPPQSKPGDYIVFRAEAACVAVMSCCPNDIATVNNSFSDCAFEVLPAA